MKYVPIFLVPAQDKILTPDQRVKQINEFNQKISKLMNDYKVWTIFAQLTPDD